MFNKILIANRGEIACRVIQTCRKLGIASVAIYSDAEPEALHVQMADQAYNVGGSLAADSYLNIERILEVAIESGADAVHPGYGFLSENPNFLKACEEHGIRFIGPSPEVMVRMGDKVLARILASEAGLPIVPGTEAEVEDDEALEAAAAIGYPLMVKAAEGGGGIGIRLVNDSSQLLEIMELARSLAKNAFGSPRLYLEKYLQGAAHIEIQILGDSFGHVVHLFERDCSVQRRNQKVIEETPSLKVNQTLLEQMVTEALMLARYIDYTGVGTVEFLVDHNSNFYFLEMNTRLQVEHGVTEFVTGIDLVEQQLRVAAGEPLGFDQGGIQRWGHSIEARIYPEDPVTFMPSAGTISQVYLPKGPGIRVDHALFPGYEVSAYYDPLLAKLIVWGKDRDEATLRMSDALQDLHLEGITNNVPLIQTILQEASFIRGSYDTSILAQMLPSTKGSATILAGHGISVTTNSNISDAMAAAIAEALLILKREAAHSIATENRWKRQSRREQLHQNQFGKESWHDA